MALLLPVQAGASGVVTSCDEVDLRTAVTGGGVVTFVCDGTIALTAPIPIGADTLIDAADHQIAIDGGHTTSLFAVEPGVRLTLVNLGLSNGSNSAGGAIRIEGGTLNATNCFFAGNSAANTNEAYGGAICNNAGFLNLSRCFFSNNKAFVTGTGVTGTNGGPFAPGGTGGLGDPAGGGAIWSSGSAVLEDCYFIGNRCSGGLGGAGAVSSSQRPSGAGGSGGSASGGAFFHLQGTLHFFGCTFASNSVTGGFGGMGGGQASAAGGGPGLGGEGGMATGAGVHAISGTVAGTNNTFFGNASIGGIGGTSADFLSSGGGSGLQGGPGGNAFGGGIFTSNAVVFLFNNTFTQNAATGGSGGAGGLGPYSTVCCSTLVGPAGRPGDGQGGGVATRSNTLTLAATILAFNSGGNGFGPFTDRGFNISSDASLQFTNEGGWMNLDPKLLPLADNGGPTPTMALQPDSPAIDHCTRGSQPVVDQRGISRSQGLAADAGAYELNQEPSIPAGDTDWLRASVAAGGLVIPPGDGVFRLNAPLVITRDTTIDASGHAVTLTGGGGSRVLQINAGVTLKLIHVTIRDGHATNGAGLYNDGGEVTLVGCVLEANHAIGLSGVNGSNAWPKTVQVSGGSGSPGSDAAGGAIFNTGWLYLTNCSFSGNSAQGGQGGNGGRGSEAPFWFDAGRCRSSGPGGGGAGGNGGYGLGGAIYNLGDIAMEQVSIAGSRAAGGTGGYGGSVGNIRCVIFSGPVGAGGNGGNGGTGRGGAVYNAGRLDLGACTLFQNSADGGGGSIGGVGAGSYSPSGTRGTSGTGNGGAIFNSGSNSLVNVTVVDNAASGGNCADAVGGALDNSGRVLATNCTLWANTSIGGTAGNGCSVPGRSLAASINTGNGALTLLLNTIVGSSDSTSNCVGTISDAGHNICSDASAALAAPGSLNNTDPKLGPLVNNGGPTLTFGLDPGSPALDAGDPYDCLEVDQRGVARPVGTACDIGAFEGTNGLHYVTLRSSFGSFQIVTGAVGTLHFDLMNPDTMAASDISFSISIPPMLSLAPGFAIQNNCGSGTLLTNNDVLTVAGVQLSASQACSLAMGVTSATPGLYTMVLGHLELAQTGLLPWSQMVVFDVLGAPATSALTTNRSHRSVTLAAEVDANGAPTTVWFEFGLTTAYGSTIPVALIPGLHGKMRFTREITGLTPMTEYHWRVVATNAIGTTYSADRSFVTLGGGPETALRLDGVDDYVASPELSRFFSNETVTIEVWFKAEAPGVIVDERGSPASGWADTQIEILLSGEVKARVWPLAAVRLGFAEFESWHHAVLRYDKANTNLDGFLDGLEADGDIQGDRQAPWESGVGQYYLFGAGETTHLGSGKFFTGQIGEVRIWNTARTADEIRTNRFGRLSGMEAGLVCYWRFDEGEGIAANDTSPNTNTAALVGGVVWVASTGVPDVITDSISEISPTSATLNALVNPNGTVTLAYFEYGLSTNYTARTASYAIDDVKRVNVSQSINGLFPGVEYHYRAVASNDFGIAYGKEAIFVSLGLPASGNTAIGLDGVDDFVVTPDLRNAFSNESVTIELWFKPFTPGIVIDERGQLPPEPGWQDSQMEILTSGEVRIRVWNLASLSLGAVLFGTWHHAVLRYDKATANFDGFLDGVEAAVDVSGDRTAPWESGYGMYYAFGLGDSAHLGSGKYLTGEIDEVRIWNVARSNAEISTNRFRRLTGLEPGLICYWRLDESSGPASDSSGRGNHGSALNGAQRRPSTAPIMDSMRLTRLPDGRLQLDYLAAPGSVAVLQASTNLTDWTSVRTNNVASDGLTTFEDIATPQLSHEFYRVISP